MWKVLLFRGPSGESSEFMGFCVVMFCIAVRLSESESRVVQQLEQSAAVQLITDLDPDETYGSLEELEFHTIGNLLPDDEEDLLAGVADDYDLPPSRRDEVTTEEQDEFDLFSSGGGMELEGDSQDALGVYMSKYRAENGLTGGAPGQQSGAAGSVAGEHPYGEHPSRTLFVRNINSNVEDTELRALFEVQFRLSGSFRVRFASVVICD